jgi:hypothetical protein
MWRVILPKVFKYELYPTKEKLKDGTVVTIVSSPRADESTTADRRLHLVPRKEVEGGRSYGRRLRGVT